MYTIFYHYYHTDRLSSVYIYIYIYQSTKSISPLLKSRLPSMYNSASSKFHWSTIIVPTTWLTNPQNCHQITMQKYHIPLITIIIHPVPVLCIIHYYHILSVTITIAITIIVTMEQPQNNHSHITIVILTLQIYIYTCMYVYIYMYIYIHIFIIRTIQFLPYKSISIVIQFQ